MLADNVYRIYRFSFYLNATHNVEFNGVRGEMHSHTWQFKLKILIHRDDWLQFSVYEDAISRFFDKYQNTVLNDNYPFNGMIPTLENIVDFFGMELRPIVANLKGVLLELEGSETPTRSYAIVFPDSNNEAITDYKHDMDAASHAFDMILGSLE